MLNQFFLLCTSDINIVSECQLMFNFKIPNEQLAQRKDNFIRSLHCVMSDLDFCKQFVFVHFFLSFIFLLPFPVNKDVYNISMSLSLSGRRSEHINRTSPSDR